MSEKIQISLLAIGLILIVIDIFKINSILDQLERNQEILRKAINKLERLKTNDNKNTNAHNTEKE